MTQKTTETLSCEPSYFLGPRKDGKWAAIGNESLTASATGSTICSFS